MPKKLFQNKVSIVTGGGSGIGFALGAKLVSEGSIVYLAGDNLEQLEQAQRHISEQVSQAKTRIELLDVSVAEDFTELAEKVIREQGCIDFLFNNAGITLLSEFQNSSPGQSRRVVEVNLVGVINGIHAVYPQMISQGSGHIVNTASLAGLTGYPTSAAYAASKAGVIAFSKSLRMEAEAYGVKVSAVCPGYVDTNIFREDRIVGQSPESVIQNLPFSMISAEQAAKTILQGVAANKEMILFPFYAKATSFLAKVCPILLKLSYMRLLQTFRKQ